VIEAGNRRDLIDHDHGQAALARNIGCLRLALLQIYTALSDHLVGCTT